MFCVPIIPDFEPDGMKVAKRTGSTLKPAKTGDVIASGPWGVVVPLSIYPNIAVQQPHPRLECPHA